MADDFLRDTGLPDIGTERPLTSPDVPVTPIKDAGGFFGPGSFEGNQGGPSVFTEDKSQAFAQSLREPAIEPKKKKKGKFDTAHFVTTLADAFNRIFLNVDIGTNAQLQQRRQIALDAEHRQEDIDRRKAERTEDKEFTGGETDDAQAFQKGLVTDKVARDKADLRESHVRADKIRGEDNARTDGLRSRTQILGMLNKNANANFTEKDYLDMEGTAAQRARVIQKIGSANYNYLIGQETRLGKKEDAKQLKEDSRVSQGAFHHFWFGTRSGTREEGGGSFPAVDPRTGQPLTPMMDLLRDMAAGTPEREEDKDKGIAAAPEVIGEIFNEDGGRKSWDDIEDLAIEAGDMVADRFVGQNTDMFYALTVQAQGIIRAQAFESGASAYRAAAQEAAADMELKGAIEIAKRDELKKAGKEFVARAEIEDIKGRQTLMQGISETIEHVSNAISDTRVGDALKKVGDTASLAASGADDRLGEFLARSTPDLMAKLAKAGSISPDEFTEIPPNLRSPEAQLVFARENLSKDAFADFQATNQIGRQKMVLAILQNIVIKGAQ